MVAVMARTKIKVEQFNQEDEGFWELMGRYFASAKVKRDLGIAMNSDETYQWFLAFIGDRLAGFCALSPAKTGTDLKHLYVVEGEGVETQLLGCAIAAASKPLRATVREDEFALYEKQGFKVVKRRGQYIQIER